MLNFVGEILAVVGKSESAEDSPAEGSGEGNGTTSDSEAPPEKKAKTDST